MNANASGWHGNKQNAAPAQFGTAYIAGVAPARIECNKFRNKRRMNVAAVYVTAAQRRANDGMPRACTAQNAYNIDVTTFGIWRMCETCGCGQATAQNAARRTIAIEEDVLARNNEIAAAVRHSLAHRHALMLNMLSAPGAGKTLLLETALPRVTKECAVAVLEGDVQTRYDAERLRRRGIDAVQINTGGACHLDAAAVQTALARPPLATADLIIIENVGNLVCPAAFDLGEDAKIVLLSVTEGDDKPEKYPAAFAVADLMLVTKVDLLPHVTFDMARCKEAAWQVHPGLTIMEISAHNGDGVDAWLDWLRHRRAHKTGAAHSHDNGPPHEHHHH
jgi:hydrogenase nickel incorporation protein HypB